MRRLLGALLLGALAAAWSPAAAGAQERLPTLDGGGSTWSQIAVDQWRSDVARQGLKVNFQGVGSTAGRSFYINGQVDFAVSEIPFLPEEQADAARKPYTYLPIVAGGTALMYNLVDAAGKRITDLRLSPRTIAGIFTGRIRNWNDPAITADHGRALPARAITPVLRSDGSGTSAQFTAWLSKVTPDLWSSFTRSRGLGPGPTSFFPEFPNNGSKAQSGSDGVANYVASDAIGRGAITYVEYGYALQRSFPVASVLNAAGYFVQPTAENVAVGLTRARVNPDRTQVLDGVYANPDPRTYPISSYSYLIAPTQGFDEGKGQVLGRFIAYFVCAGQQKAKLLGYSPLPPNLVQFAFEAMREIPGAPPAPASCANPTITGGFTPQNAPLPPPSAHKDFYKNAAAPVAAGTPGAGVATGVAEPGAGGVASAVAGAGGGTQSASGPEVAAGGTGRSGEDGGPTELALLPVEPVGFEAGSGPSPVGPVVAAAAVLVGVFGLPLLRRRRPATAPPETGMQEV